MTPFPFFDWMHVFSLAIPPATLFGLTNLCGSTGSGLVLLHSGYRRGPPALVVVRFSPGPPLTWSCPIDRFHQQKFQIIGRSKILQSESRSIPGFHADAPEFHCSSQAVSLFCGEARRACNGLHVTHRK